MHQAEIIEHYKYHRKMVAYYRKLLPEDLCSCGQLRMSGQGMCKECMYALNKKYRETPAGIQANKERNEKYKKSRTYIARMLSMDPSDLTDELYELKLATFKLKRNMEATNE